MGDVLLFGQAGASAEEFFVRFAHTASDIGERSGEDAVEETFVNYQCRTVWAMVDGGGEMFDLLA